MTRVLIQTILMAALGTLAVCAQVRSKIDRSDGSPGPLVHFIYAVPSDGQDHAYDTNGDVDRAVKAIQSWLASKTGGKRLRVDMDGDKVDVSFVRLFNDKAFLSDRSDRLLSLLEAELAAAGFRQPNKLYVVLYDGPHPEICGEAYIPWVHLGRVVAAYLQADPCDKESFTSGADPTVREFGILHEILHGLGFGYPASPNATPRGHVNDSADDVMYDGEGRGAWTPSVLDENNDDYFHHNRHWIDLAKSVFLADPNQGGQWPPEWAVADLDPLKKPPRVLRSSPWSAQDRSRIKLYNLTADEIQVYRTDDAGIRIHIGALKPWDSLSEDTVPDEYWEAADNCGERLKTFRARPGSQRAYVEGQLPKARPCK